MLVVVDRVSREIEAECVAFRRHDDIAASICRRLKDVVNVGGKRSPPAHDRNAGRQVKRQPARAADRAEFSVATPLERPFDTHRRISGQPVECGRVVLPDLRRLME